MISPMKFLLSNGALLASIASALPTVSGPTSLNATALDSTIGKPAVGPHENQKRAASCSIKGGDIKVMTLGASQAVGYPSQNSLSAYEGYRPELARLSSKNNINITYSGLSSKVVLGQEHMWTGAPGMKIGDLQNLVQPTVGRLASHVVILNAGTSDILYSTDVHNKGDSEDDIVPLIDSLLGWCTGYAYVPVIILSGLPIIKDDKFQARAHGLNAQYKIAADRWRNQGFPVLFADVGSVLSESDLLDISNPTISGYNKLAAVYADTLEEAYCNGWL